MSKEEEQGGKETSDEIESHPQQPWNYRSEREKREEELMGLDMSEESREQVSSDKNQSRKSSRANTSLVLMPNILPWGELGSALLLQFILTENGDEMNLLSLTLGAGLVSLAIVLHASFMGYIFKSFGTIVRFIIYMFLFVKFIHKIIM